MHRSVLLQELIDTLALVPHDVVFDGTVNGGGHAAAVVAKLNARGVFIGCDLDQEALDRSAKRLAGATATIHLVKSNFRNLDTVLKKEGIERVSKVYFDLGLSSDELENSGRGFTFRKDEPLLMTFDNNPRGMLTAREIVNEWAEESLADIIYGYGEERAARKIARAVVEGRSTKPIETTGELVSIIERVIPRRGKIHPATKTFQALRIAVNDELGALKEGLSKSYEWLESGGRIAVISFHSAEDRIVKDTFRAWRDGGKGVSLTKKPIVPSVSEVEENPRSRSSKLRIFLKS